MVARAKNRKRNPLKDRISRWTKWLLKNIWTFFLLMAFWKFQHFNLESKIPQKLFKPLPCHKRIGKLLHAVCISAVAVSLRWASYGPWASCLFLPKNGNKIWAVHFAVISSPVQKYRKSYCTTSGIGIGVSVGGSFNKNVKVLLQSFEDLTFLKSSDGFSSYLIWS